MIGFPLINTTLFFFAFAFVQLLVLCIEHHFGQLIKGEFSNGNKKAITLEQELIVVVGSK